MADTNDPFAALPDVGTPGSAAPQAAPPVAMPAAGTQPPINPPEQSAGAPTASSDPFAALPDVQPASTVEGAFLHSAERGFLPAAVSLPAMGAGAEIGAAGGAAIGSAVPVVGTAAGALVGGIVGGISGGIAGSYTGSVAQEWGLSKAPDSWKEAIGQDDRQRQLEESQHPMASFLGGIAPYALTMRPGLSLAESSLPANATSFQKLMANPMTSRIFGGAAMGGMEAGNEKLHGGDIEWPKVAIATAFGLIFNQPTKFGEALTGFGARSIMSPFEPHPTEAVATTPEPTVIQAADLGVMGPGITEDTFQGVQKVAPNAADTSSAAAREETAALGQPPEVDLHALVRRNEPDLFTKYDALSQQREEFRNWIAEYNNPPPEDFAAAQKTAADLQAQLDAHVESQNGYTGGPEARRLRAQVRDAQSALQELQDRQTAFAEGRAQETPDLQMARQHLLAVDYQMRDMAPDVSAAYRRAADMVDQGIEPETMAPDEAPVAAPAANAEVPAGVAPETEGAAPGAPTPAAVRPIEEQLAYISSNIADKLKAAGRPADEAAAAGALLAARYQTRSERLGGALGTPEELYNTEGPEIKAGKSRAKQPEMAQGRTMQGKITLNDGEVKPIITLAKNADASTFVHETGHQWLEELMRDAGHEAAPDALKTDAGTVRTWLGANEGEPIKTRQHEKFARGFEQYMREGIAPTPKLANVFAQFRNWLVNIYQTLKGLGQPISPEISGVFDRMIATEPRRTVFAPERELPSALADMHEADARETHPAEADAALDRVNSEKNQYIRDQPPEVINELENAYREITAAAQPSGEGEPGASGHGQVEPSGGEPQSQPPGGTGGEEHGTLIPSRNETGTKGAELPGGNRSTGAAAGGTGPTVSGPEQRPVSSTENEHPLAPTPTDQFAPGESPYLDKAGNIRLDNIQGPEDIKQAMRDTAKANGDFMEDRGGVISDGQVLDFANQLLGEDPDMSLSRTIKKTVLSSNIKAAQKLLADSQYETHRLAKVAVDSGSDADLLAFTAAQQRLALVQGYYSGAQAEIARAFRALRKTQEFWSPEAHAASESPHGQTEGQEGQVIRDATGRDLFQMRRMAEQMAKMDTPEQIAKFMRDARKRSFGRMMHEYFVNNLISGPISHMTYAVGNVLNSLDTAISVTPVAAALGKAYRMAGYEGDRVMLGEAYARLQGGVQGIPKAVEAALGALRTGVGTVLPGEGSHQMFYQGDIPQHLGYELQNDATRLHDITGQAYGLLQGIYDAFTVRSAEGNGIGLYYSPTGQIPDVTIAGRRLLPIGTLARLPSRGVGAFDSFFRAANYSMEKSALAYRTASQEGLAGAEFHQRIADIRQNPSEELMDKARPQASNLTMMGQTGAMMQKLTPLLNWAPEIPLLGETPVFRFIVPFARVAANVINESVIKRTPLGILSGELRADLTGKNGGGAMQMAQARMITGTMYSLAVMGLAAQGKITGGGPSDPKQAAAYRLAVGPPYSVKIGNTWYSYKRLDPFGFLFGVAADLHEVIHDVGDDHAADAAHLIVNAVAQNLIDESFMRGASDAIRALTDDKRYGAAWVSNMAAGFVPYATGLAQASRAIDPYSRRASGFVDKLKAKIPFMSEGLYPRRDVWGEPVPNTHGLGHVTNIYESQVTNDPVNQALYRLNIFPSRVEGNISNVKLTDQQYDDYSRLAGRLTKQRLDVIVKSPDWRRFTDDQRRMAVNNQIEANRNVARNMMLMKYPQIARDAYVLQHARATGQQIKK
jgi:hypothetical protein